MEKQEWISVNSGLPKDGQYVLVFYKIRQYDFIDVGKTQGWKYPGDGSERTARWLDEEGRDIRPTHWMPLPEPPKQTT